MQMCIRFNVVNVEIVQSYCTLDMFRLKEIQENSPLIMLKCT